MCLVCTPEFIVAGKRHYNAQKIRTQQAVLASHNNCDNAPSSFLLLSQIMPLPLRRRPMRAEQEEGLICVPYHIYGA